MRFLLGLMFGAGAVLLVAGGAAGGDWRVRAEQWLAGATAAVRAGVTEVITAPQNPSAPEPAPETATTTPVGAISRSRTEPTPTTNQAEEETVAETTGREMLVGDRGRDPEVRDLEIAPTERMEGAAEPIPRPPDPEPVERLEALAGVQNVWAPFHSEMSASGFATRLTESLDHPFRVERRGPRQYQVVFAYRSEPERRALLAQAAEATGLLL